jgi:hypothetical protein
MPHVEVQRNSILAGELPLSVANGSTATKGQYPRANGAGTYANVNPFWIDPVADYGCKFDLRFYKEEGAIESGSKELAVTGYVFTAADIGKKAMIVGAGTTAPGNYLAGEITGVNAGKAVLSVTATTTVITKETIFGTDDTAALNAVFAAEEELEAGIYARKIILPAVGTALFTQLLFPRFGKVEGATGDWQGYGTVLGTFTGCQNLGSANLYQMWGANEDGIYFRTSTAGHESNSTEYTGQICGFRVQQDLRNTSGKGINFLNGLGEELLLVDGSKVERICVMGFAGNGWNFPRGFIPGAVKDIASFDNGYVTGAAGIRTALANSITHFQGLTSGDKNAGGLIEVFGKTKPQHGIVVFDAIKSEFGHNNLRDPNAEAAPQQKHALVLNNLETANVIGNLSHHADGDSCPLFAPTANTVITGTVINLTGAKAKGFVNGKIVSFTKLTAGVTGLVANKQYFVVGEATNGFEVSATEGGAAIAVAGHELETATTEVAQINAIGTAILVTRNTVTDAAMTATSKVLKCATSTPFNSTMVGETAVVTGAGVAGATLTAKITKYTSASEVELETAASTTVAAATAQVPVLAPNIDMNVVVTLTSAGQESGETARVLEDENTGTSYTGNGGLSARNAHFEYSTGTSTFQTGQSFSTRHHMWGTSGGYQGEGNYGEQLAFQIAGSAVPVFSIYNGGAPAGKRNFGIIVDNEGNVSLTGLKGASNNELEPTPFMKITRTSPGSSTVIPGLVDKVRVIENEAINIAVEDKVIAYKTLAGNHAVNLPKLSEVVEGKLYRIIIAAATAGILTITPKEGDTLVGLNTVTTAGSVRTVQAVAGVWVGF